MKDLYQQDLVEMIERESRNFQIWTIGFPSHPDFAEAYELLWNEFGPHGGMERIEAVRSFLLEDPYEPTAAGTFMRYFLLVAKDDRGNILGARDGVVLLNQAYDSELVVVFLSHIVMKPEARGTVLSYWMRIAPVELAMQYVNDLASMGKITVPAPDNPGRHYGMKVNLAAEMEYFAPDDPISLQRILFYGRGGFDAINPRYFPYRQPDFRDPEVIRATGNQPVPFMMLLRRMGRERQASIPTDEARAVMRLLYDDFATHCLPEHLEGSLDAVLQQLETRQDRGSIELLPCPPARATFTAFAPSSATPPSPGTTPASPTPSRGWAAAWSRRSRPTRATSKTSSRRSPMRSRCATARSTPAATRTSSGSRERSTGGGERFGFRTGRRHLPRTPTCLRAARCGRS